jgi:transcriptional regulator with XRE-family HTH domain
LARLTAGARPTALELRVAEMVQPLLAWSASLPSTPPQMFLLPNLRSASAAVGGGKPLAKLLDLSPASVGFWLRARQRPTLSSLLRLALVFGVPPHDWLAAPLTPDRFARVAELSPNIEWLSDRKAPVAPAEIEAALRRALACDTGTPASIVSIARGIPASVAHVHRKFPTLVAQIVDRRRAFCSARKVATAAQRQAMVREAIQQIEASGNPITAYAVEKLLGTRWPRSRRRLKAVFAQVLRA